MVPITDKEITHAIQQLGMLKVQQLRQELIEGMRNGDPQGYPALRLLLQQLPRPPFQGDQA